MATFSALAQDAAPERPFPQTYNTYDDYRDYTQVVPEAGNTDAPQDDNRHAMDIDDLEALLPEHLRAPLPVKGTPQSAQEERTYPIQSDEAIAPASPMESFYREATGDGRLVQYGYDFLSRRGRDVPAPSGAIQDDYILGSGDRLNVMFLGERKDRASYRIDRNGSLSIDMLPSIAASGKTLEGLRRDLQHMLDAQGYHGEVFISLENIRSVSVLVAGHVPQPGRHRVTPLQTVLEALEEAGGVQKTGTLRQIRLVRGGESTLIDLYGMMGVQKTAAAMPALQDGDRIIVPPLGPTIALTGDVRQPGIYELPARKGIDAAAALNLAGGVLSSGQNRITLMTPQSDGRRTAVEIGRGTKTALNDGAILSVTRTADRAASSFSLLGEVRSPGSYPLMQYPKLSKLMRSPQTFGDDVYPLLGVVSRRRAEDLARDLVAFSPQDVFMGRADLPLQDGDQVRLFARGDVLDVMKQEKTTLPPLVQTFILEHAVSIQGAVRLPGSWPVAGPVPVARILDVAGGALSDADLSRAEILRNDVGLIDVSAGAVSRRDVVNLADAGIEGVTVTFGDALRIPDRFEAVTRQSVTLFGEVRNPGTYDLMRGDTLLTLIDRAGGLTDQAYPLGAVFSRAAERKREKEKFSAAARDLERAIAMAAQGDDGKVDMAQMALAKELVDELKTIEPVGRVTVESDPGILRQDPAQDILLEAGDRIYMPKRPLSVRVTGEILSPAALQFRADKKTSDYLAEAGGLTHHADKGRIFVLYPNGSAQPLSAGSWTSIKPVMITPGSTIVVPRDPKPFSFIESAKDITQILSNLAITGIYAEDLVGRN